MKKLNKMIFLSLLVSIGLALSVLESAIPLPVTIPGARLGLSNVVILVTLVIFGFKESLIVGILKSIVLILVTGSVSSLIYSLSGAILASITMYVIYKYFSKVFSLIGVSVLGAVAHNIGQVSAAVLMMSNLRIYSYLPILLLMSLFTGYFVGLSSNFITKNLVKSLKSYFI
ncbi:Gx transporter family protein [Tissierella sp. MB52-C2]|uniref:Gx transporter family protein n=1 Tax=Tissierella sp. MB52-C2 TaxID=3070999 RepID=UPI00280AE69C|nr:Gx transporter family protein [Tissierella sp. MB52-C2]WMM23561.1 Gx transporter family protein [Tissierella sp. MB52-C2]